MDIKAQTYKLIDDLKAVCHNYGMGNDGNRVQGHYPDISI